MYIYFDGVLNIGLYEIVTVYGKTGHNAACVISRKDRSIS